MARLFEQEVFIPSHYTGTMPNGDKLQTGVKFLDFRSQYLENKDVQAYKTAYDNAVATGGDITEAMESVERNLHRFWHAGDILMALGTMYELYPDMKADYYSNDPVPTDPTEPTTEDPSDDPTGETGDDLTDPDLVAKAKWGDANVDGTVDVADIVALNMYLLNTTNNALEAQGKVNANCNYDGVLDSSDSVIIMNYVAMIIEYGKLGPQ